MTENLKEFGACIDLLITGNHLSRDQSMVLFSQILNGRQTDMHQGAFLSAITAKGPTPQEIAGAWEAIYNIDTVKVTPDIDGPIIDNCGTGMDGVKTFNISTAGAIVAASGGVRIARHGSRAITSSCGTVDLCETLGIDVECPVDIVKSSLEKTGICLFNGMSATVHPNALFRILSQIRFGSILNIAASLANPVKPEFGVRGVYSRQMIQPVISSMKEIGYKRALVFHGLSGSDCSGMDELSPLAESHVAELFEDGMIRHYTVSPHELGICRPSHISQIYGGNDPQTEALRLLNVLMGNEKGAIYETICLNTAPVFYIAGDVSTLREGVEKARDMIDSGLALAKLSQWVQHQNPVSETGKCRLEALMSRLN